MAGNTFQNFDAAAAPVIGNERLSKLRRHMGTENIDAVIVPHADEQNNEYLPSNKERLAWLTGFSGSAGFAIVTQAEAFLFVDGRYTLQASDQADLEHWQIRSSVDFSAGKWIKAYMLAEQAFGFDPWLHAAKQVNGFQQAVDDANCVLNPLDRNPIDAVWDDRPPAPSEPVNIHEFEYSGLLTFNKLEALQGELAIHNADFCVLTDPASVCWLFNIRGSDVAHTPIVLSHAIIKVEGEPLIFVDDRKLNIETRSYLTQVATLCDPLELNSQITDLAKDKNVMLDPDISPYGFSMLVENSGGTVIKGKDPVSLPRAVKNTTEIEGSRNAHLRDGAAMATFLAWLDDQKPGSIDEIQAARRLEQIRAEMATKMPLRDISFDTISGSGPNGAIVHYRVNKDSNRVLQSGELYLCDSGAQYDDGTTDITRTVAIGPVGDDERRAFTLVLRGHIAIALARFPEGTRGLDIDPLARMPLWQNGMDYAHGTGHGVGSYLSVHEGPQSISKRGQRTLLPGMIISNEPGYYREGKFGIRIENLVLVSEAQDIEGGDQAMLGFQTLTLCPIDQRLIDPTMMTDEELHWLNAYHGWVRRELEPLVSDTVAKWLRQATEPIIRDLPSASA